MSNLHSLNSYEAFSIAWPVLETSLPNPFTVLHPFNRNSVDKKKQIIAIFLLFFIFILLNLK